MLTGTPPNLTYNPDSGFSGRDSFTYYATDAGAESGNLAIVSLIVNGSAILFVGDAAAVLADDTVNYPGDVTVKNEIISLGFTVTVVDDNNVLSGAFNIADIDMVDLLIISSSNGSVNFVNSPYMTDLGAIPV